LESCSFLTTLSFHTTDTSTSEIYTLSLHDALPISWSGGTTMSEQSARTRHTAQDLPGRYREALLPVFGTPQRVLARGEGCRVWDTAGTEYLDLLGGIAVNTLGHAHPAILSALSTQAQTLGHVSNFFATIPQIELAERLLQLAEAPTGSGVFFANSGSEANEAA